MFSAKLQMACLSLQVGIHPQKQLRDTSAYTGMVVYCVVLFDFIVDLKNFMIFCTGNDQVTCNKLTLVLLLSDIRDMTLNLLLLLHVLFTTIK